MLCKFYKTTSPKNAINKVLTDEVEKDLFLKDDVNILRPDFNITIFDGIFTYNYAYVPDFSRYYFIDDIVILTVKIVQVRLKVDVLETWKSDILTANCHITKDNNSNMYGASIATSQKRTSEVLTHSPIFELQDYFIMSATRGELYSE